MQKPLGHYNDVQGNLASKNGVTYQFDYGNRLRSDSINAETFRYDGLGHRQRADSTSLGEILWLTGRDGKPVWMANRREGGIAHTYLYLGNQLVATQIYDAATNPVLYQTTDTLGSVIAQTNQEAWVDHFNYYQPWGGLQSGSLDDGPGYANQINDTNTGLSYAQQRYYDPSVGRFMSMDPVDANTVTGGNFNRYVYANDNPYRYTDPDGRLNSPDYGSTPVPTCTGSRTPGGCSAENVTVYQVGEPSATQERAARSASSMSASDKQDLQAETYAEKTTGSVSEYKAIISVVINRALSGDKQYVDKGDAVNVHNVLNHTQAFQGLRSVNAADFRDATNHQVSNTARENITNAFSSIQKDGSITNATFFIANPRDGAPTSREVGALGNVVPAEPPNVGGVYLYSVNPPDQ